MRIEGSAATCSQLGLEVARAVRVAVAVSHRTLVLLVNTQLPQINECAVCFNIDVGGALADGETRQRLPASHDTTLFTGAESAALTLADSMTMLSDARTQKHDDGEAGRQSPTRSSPRSAAW